jgi:hypothetical protein
VPEVAPASSRKGWSRPWSGRGGKWDGADPHHPYGLSGQGLRTFEGEDPSPLPGIEGPWVRRSLVPIRPKKTVVGE